MRGWIYSNGFIITNTCPWTRINKVGELIETFGILKEESLD